MAKPSRFAAPGSLEPGGRRSSYVPAINGLRGLCVMMVFVYHVFNAGLVDWPQASVPAQMWAYFMSAQRYGVELFFMISGYVILGSLMRHASVAAFFKDRAIRIFSLWLPLHVAICVLGVSFSLWIFANPEVKLWQVFLANLFLLAPLLDVAATHPASWTLTYEWLFYLSAALIYFWRRQVGGAWALLLAVLIVAAYVHSLPRALFFLPGVLAFVAAPYQAQLRPYLKAPLVSLLVFLLAWRATGADLAEPGYPLSNWFGDVRIWMAALAFLAAAHFFACLAYRSSSQLRFLESRSFQFLGAISFSLYLLSPLVMFVVKKLVLLLWGQLMAPWLLLLLFAGLSLLVSLLLAYLSWRLFEVQLARHLKNVFGAPRASVAAELPHIKGAES